MYEMVDHNKYEINEETASNAVNVNKTKAKSEVRHASL